MTTAVEERRAPPELEAALARSRTTATDIVEHLDRLRALAAACEHVTEFGVRGANGSTVALLAGQPSTFVAWDINPAAIVSQAVLDLLRVAGFTRFQPRVGDSLLVSIEPTDLLLIDTLHTADQLASELARHEEHVARWIALHDTATFGDVGEDGGPGLRDAVARFLERRRWWWIREDCPHNNGLMILERRAAWQPRRA